MSQGGGKKMGKVFTSEKAGYEISVRAEWIGNDLLLSIFGGDTPHIGTVTTFFCEKQVQHFPSHDGRYHKDDVLADLLLKVIDAELPGNCVITSGVHVDHISKEQIASSFRMIEEIAIKLSLWIKEHPLAKAPIYD